MEDDLFTVEGFLEAGDLHDLSFLNQDEEDGPKEAVLAATPRPAKRQVTESHPLLPLSPRKVSTPQGLLQDAFQGLLQAPRVHALEQMREWVFSGDEVPSALRGRAWQLQLEPGRDFEVEYAALCNSRIESPSEKQILLDVDRTLPELERFRSISNYDTRLFRILRAYALHNPTVGYCQGMASLVAALMTEVSNDAFVFGLLDHMLGPLGLASFYEPGMSGILSDGATFRSMLHVVDASLASHLEQHGVVPLMYITQWFLCVFTSLDRWDHTLRCFDHFLIEGRRSLFRFALAILSHVSEKLRSMNGLEVLLPYLLRLPAHDIDGFHERALGFAMEEIETLATELVLDASEQKAMPLPSSTSQKRRREESGATLSSSLSAGVLTPRKRAAPASPKTPGGSSFFNRWLGNWPSPVKSTLGWKQSQQQSSSLENMAGGGAGSGLRKARTTSSLAATTVQQAASLAENTSSQIAMTPITKKANIASSPRMDLSPTSHSYQTRSATRRQAMASPLAPRIRGAAAPQPSTPRHPLHAARSELLLSPSSPLLQQPPPPPVEAAASMPEDPDFDSNLFLLGASAGNLEDTLQTSESISTC